MSRIPTVREWRVTLIRFVKGASYRISVRVLAPTRHLAALSVRAEGYHGPIESIGRPRILQLGAGQRFAAEA